MSFEPVETTDVVKQVTSLRDLIALLREDVERSKATNDETGRRSLVRAVFAYIEGTSFGFRSAALALARMRRVELDTGEVMVAQEVVFSLNEKGKVEERVAFSPPLANLRFSLTLFAKATGADYEFPAGDSNFEKLQTALRVRNRLMHPRTIEDLSISEEERDAAVNAAEWIGAEHEKLVRVIAYRLVSGLDNFYKKALALPRSESGGIPVEPLGALLTEWLTSPHPVTKEEVDAWFENVLRTLARRPDGAA